MQLDASPWSSCQLLEQKEVPRPMMQLNPSTQCQTFLLALEMQLLMAARSLLARMPISFLSHAVWFSHQDIIQSDSWSVKIREWRRQGAWVCVLAPGAWFPGVVRAFLAGTKLPPKPIFISQVRLENPHLAWCWTVHEPPVLVLGILRCTNKQKVPKPKATGGIRPGPVCDLN